MASEKYVIGIDGGGTKTTALLTSLDGTVVAEARGGAANMAVAGAAQTADVIFALILQCCTYAGCTFDDLQNIVLGLAGMGRKGERAELSNALFDLATKRGSPLRNIRIETDADIALEAAFAGGPGIVVIGGTGAIAVYRAENGEQIRAGGWGRILGDEGSGYALGRDGLNAVMRELDGRGDKTLLTKKALEHYGVASLDEVIQKVYYEGADVAGFSRRVLEAITERDHVANRIAVDNVNELVNLAAVLVKKQPPKRKLPVALMGSLLETENPYAKLVRERIPAAAPYHAAEISCRIWCGDLSVGCIPLLAGRAVDGGKSWNPDNSYLNFFFLMNSNLFRISIFGIRAYPKTGVRSLVFLSIIISLVVSSCSHKEETVRSELPKPVSAAARPSKSAWIDTTLAHMSLEDEISQMIMCRAYGYYYSSGTDEYKHLQRLVKERKVGGFVFFQGDVDETASLINRLQSNSKTPLLIAADFEWGAAMRLRRATRFPENMALGATRDTSLAYAMGKAIGEESRAIGVEQIYAPDADVNVNPENPVINTRSFGEDPQLVASMADAFISGAQSAGVIATAKHFPGHGDTQVDSHLDLPVIPFTRGRLDSVELVPFKSIVQRGAGSIMVAHLVVPALDPAHGIPATLSQPIISQYLEGDLGYRGIVVSDAMEMGAIVNSFGPESSAVKAVEAGDDMLVLLPDEDRGVNAIANAVRSGRITRERINVSVRKILGAKYDAGLDVHRTVDLDTLASVVADPAHTELAGRIARSSITILKNDEVLPLQAFGKKKIFHLIIADIADYRTEINRIGNPATNEPAGDYFSAQLRHRYGYIQTVKLDPSNNSLDFAEALVKAQKANEVVITLYSRARSASGKFGIPDSLLEVAKEIVSLKLPTVVIAMGNPYSIADIPDAQAYVCTYSECEPSAEATAQVLFGEVTATGKLPVTIPNMFAYGSGIVLPQWVLRNASPSEVGFNADSLTRADSVVARGIRSHAFPGAQVLIAKDGAIVYEKAFGRMTYAVDSPAVNNSTMFDLASLTKVTGTTTAVMMLYDEGKIDLDTPVVSYIPEFGTKGKEKITVRNLLLHNGGLPAFKRLYLTCKSPDEVLDSVYHTEMIYRTGDSTVYSDFDFIVLGKIIEKVSGQSLDEFVQDSIFEPLRMTRTMYRPPQSLWENIAPTEYDSLDRKKQMRGEVHDENAYALGGVSGHAGLFSTSRDLATLMQMLMNGGTYQGKRYIQPSTIEMFTAKQGATSTRALGWDTKTVGGYSTAGSLFSDKSYGHTGFTGTSIWVDPTRNLLVIFLTNRVFPTRDNKKISEVRPLLHDAVIRSIVQ